MREKHCNCFSKIVPVIGGRKSTKPCCTFHCICLLKIFEVSDTILIFGKNFDKAIIWFQSAVFGISCEVFLEMSDKNADL